jgi:hypothetical protein
MSISYSIRRDDRADGDVIVSVSLSNTSHAAWQDALDVGRDMRNAETGELERGHWHTTIHDSAPLSFDADELSGFVDLLDDLGHNGNTVDILNYILVAAEEHGCQIIFV